MKAKEVTKVLESIAPLAYQESYDNSGWITGDPDVEVKGILVAVDMTMDVLDDAIQQGDNLIITHHPLIFQPLRKIVKGDIVQEILLKAVKHDIMIYSAHTSLDNAWTGVNRELFKRIGLHDFSLLKPKVDILKKLVVFVPEDYADSLREAVFKAGAGQIGDYDSCSYNLKGQGTFRAGEGTNPFVGKKNKIHFEPEQRVETVFPVHLQWKVLNAMQKAHPYEEVAYDIYSLDNAHGQVGSGAIGMLEKPLSLKDFFKLIKERLDIQFLRYSGSVEEVNKVAISGGAGSFLIPEAIKKRADVFLTADLKYHDFFMSADEFVLIDAGHYETEQFTKHLIRDILIENFSNFAVRISQVNTNPVKYY
ncbi:MAG: Nif3-like dinuclear metal center hexameric protein [Bacteroidales bacterium]|nr:Nif3-like dinuclear metal center hexameric protein [Bacteroidales bacterium]